MTNKMRLAVALGGLVVLGVLAAFVVLTHSEPVESGIADAPTQIARAFSAASKGELKLEPAGKASLVVLQSDAVPEKSAPSFFPKHVSIQGAARTMVLNRPASVVLYTGEEGPFAVISVKAQTEELEGMSPMPYRRTTYWSCARAGEPGGKLDVNLVAVPEASRFSVLVGRQPTAKLLELAAMLPR